MADFDLGHITVTNEVTAGAYNEFGFYQFVQHCEDADRRSVEEAADEGARVARYFAPERTGALRASIRATPAMGGFTGWSTRGTVWAEIHVGTNHWTYANWGAPPHEITGWVNFFWEKERRAWKPGLNKIKHPGMRGTHFMQIGTRAAEQELPQAMRRNYAGI